ncbi:hypothetical protein PJ267_04605 [Arthrobacter sp. OVS8]|nr:hypothetical protein PJ267_04605 [Arthrobacter sp. OVS8]
MIHDPYKLIPKGFTAIPSVERDKADIEWVAEFGELDALGVLVTSDGDVPGILGLDREDLARAGFNADAGTTLLLPTASGSPLLVAVGGGPSQALDARGLRNAVASLMRATARHARIGFDVPAVAGTDPATLSQALAEGHCWAATASTYSSVKRRTYRWRCCSCGPLGSLQKRPPAVWRRAGSPHVPPTSPATCATRRPATSPRPVSARSRKTSGRVSVSTWRSSTNNS